MQYLVHHPFVDDLKGEHHFGYPVPTEKDSSKGTFSHELDLLILVDAHVPRVSLELEHLLEALLHLGLRLKVDVTLGQVTLDQFEMKESSSLSRCLSFDVVGIDFQDVSAMARHTLDHIQIVAELLLLRTFWAHEDDARAFEAVNVPLHGI